MGEIRLGEKNCKELNIVRNGEDVGVFRFNPHDIKQAQNFSKFVSEMESKRVAYLEKARQLDTENNVTEKIDFLVGFVGDIRNGINQIFGVGTSEMVFGNVYDIDMIFEFLEGITPYYKEASVDRTAKYKDRTTQEA